VTTRAEALIRMAEAEDTLRAIGAGEVDAFVVSDEAHEHRVFTLATADRPYRMFVENMRDGAATVSASGLILYANRRFAELLGCARETVVGSPLERFLAPAGAVGIDELRGPGGHGAALEVELINGDGARVPVQVGSSPLVVDDHTMLCLTFTDLSVHKIKDREIARLGQAQAERLDELQVAQAALTQQATHDALTNLPNRALLVDRIDQAVAGCKRSGQFVAVLFVDLDRFKQVNDTHGHAAGDDMLRRVAGKLVDALRPTDTVARIGGDEFVVLAPEVDSQLHAVDMGTRLLSELTRRPVTAGAERISASIGISVTSRGRGDAESLLNEADTAMYEAKSLGGQRVAVFDAALGRQVRRRSIARQALQSALDDHRIIAYFQPIIDLATGTAAGFEALARIVEHDGSITPPAAFIPAAEESGLVVPLGTQVLQIALREASAWPYAGGDRPLNIAVNLSSRQFEGGNLAVEVERLLDETGLAADALHLELTETAVMDLHADFLDQLGRIAALGVQIGLDDFGTGYASLTHLRRLPLRFVKIDQSFVQGLGNDNDDDRIVGAVVDLAANLGLRSIGEGVETADQLQRLRDLGCDEAQGYFFARPLAPGDIGAAIERLAEPTRC
jgi:diguanylate cyclase (GGDEF)-like protein/PAS domain S-box-containing protein